MDEYSFMDKQAKMLTEMVEVFERNDANLFEMYRVLAVAMSVTRAQLKDMLADLGEQAEALMDGIDGLLEMESE